MRPFRRSAAALVALGLLTAACTSDPDETASDESGTEGDGETVEGSTRGITDDTIRIGFIGADFAALAEAGLAPDLGDQPKIIQSVVDQINEDGGIAGRQIEVRIKLVDGTAGPEAAQAACLEMTQDFQAFAVILAPAVSRETARCTSISNETLTLNSTGFDEALYEEAQGRLFSLGSDTSMSTDRQYAGWAQMLDDAGELEGTTIGVVSADQAPEFPAAVEDGLIPALEDLGHEVAVNVTLPCPELDIDCEQHEAAVQQMKDAGVDFVFMAAPNLVGPTVVQAAINLDFQPRWAANGNQVTDTVSQFFASVKDEWDGAVGTSTVFAEIEDLTDEAHECNDVITERSGEAYEPGSDAFGFAAVNCLTMGSLQQAGEAIEPADLNEATMIGALEGLGEITLNAGPPGSVSADKHNAGDHLFLVDFDASAEEWIERPGDLVKVD